MRAIIFSVFFFIQATSCLAQLPLQADTSFSTYSAYYKAKKEYPGIAIVAEIHAEEIKEEKGIDYCGLANRKLVLDAFYPAAKEKANGIAIIIIHGGGWRSGHRAQHYPMAQRLAQLGYACFTPEYRLSTEARFPAAIFDSKAAIRWARENAGRYNIDTARIAVLGFSAGGEIAAFVGTTAGLHKFEGTGCSSNYSSRANAVIDIDGTLSFVHPESSEGNDSKKLSAATQWLGIAKKDSIQLWEEASPLHYTGQHTPPTLFVNSAVAAMHAGRDDYVKVLEKNSIYYEVKSFENSPHTFCLFQPWFHPTVKYIDEFLRKVFIQ